MTSFSPSIRRIVVAAALLASVLACEADSGREGHEEVSPSIEPSPDAMARGSDPRPSVVLIVFDTLRADAVSSYGAIEGTTPFLDGLAREGVRYSRAYAPAPWTISSHVSLFTGLRVDQHGIGLDGASVVPDSLQMLAEDFQEAGYVTAAFAENALVSQHFGFEQGFDHFESKDIVKIMRAAHLGEATPAEFDILRRVEAWNRTRDRSRPYFLFINLFDPHDPYLPRDVNPWIPEKMTRVEAEFIHSRHPIPDALCGRVPGKEDLEVLRGLYLGEVAESDRKFEALMRLLDGDDAMEGEPRFVVATSDHGEHFGENRLMGHQFSVRRPALHIPLIIAGLPGLASGVIDDPVELREVGPAIRCWALDIDCPVTLPTADSPGVSTPPDPAPIFSIYSDSVSRLPDWLMSQFGNDELVDGVDPARLECTPEDRVFGEMVSMLRYPMKMIWYSENEVVLHDLSWDPDERFDQSELQPELAAKLRSEIEAFVQKNITERERQATPELTEEGIRALKSLGYIE